VKNQAEKLGALAGFPKTNRIAMVNIREQTLFQKLSRLRRKSRSPGAVVEEPKTHHIATVPTLHYPNLLDQ
tara:strand:- start:741 stop:953 length:213 start_codon:yes stop_codon:yes gene_type:complete